MLLPILAVSLQSTWFVDAAAVAPGDGTPSSPYTSVAYAVAEAGTVNGDTILVAPGTYPNERIDFLGKVIEVRSTGGPEVTILQAPPLGFPPGSVVTFRSGEGTNAVLEGFTLEGVQGQASPLPGPGLPFVGGGIFCTGGSSPTLRDLVITGGEFVEFGGGMFLDGGAPMMERLTFRDCGDASAQNSGGGIWARNAFIRLEECVFDGCATSSQGGAVRTTDSVVIATNCDFTANRGSFGAGGALWLAGGAHVFQECSFANNVSGDDGGAIFAETCQLVVRDSSFVSNDTGLDPHPGGALAFEGVPGATNQSVTLLRCLFSGNRGQFGGAVSIDGAGNVRDSIFEHNVAVGGQLNCGGGALSAGEATTVNGCVFVANTAIDQFSGGGGAILGSPFIDRCTFVDNDATGGAKAVDGAGVLRNSIVRGGPAPRLAASVDVSYSNVEGGASGMGNIDAAPRFHLGPADVHLLPDSPCIDVGSPTAGNDPDGTRADMGAFPFDPFHCGPGCEGFIGATTCLGIPNSTGVGAFLEAIGSSVAADRALVLNVTDVPRNQFGLFVFAATPGSTPVGGGSQGVLCLGTPLIRLNGVVSDRGTGIASYAPDLADLPTIGAVQAGQSLYFQYWYRDQNPFLTSNLSSALRVDFR